MKPAKYFCWKHWKGVHAFKFGGILNQIKKFIDYCGSSKKTRKKKSTRQLMSCSCFLIKVNPLHSNLIVTILGNIPHPRQCLITTLLYDFQVSNLHKQQKMPISP